MQKIKLIAEIGWNHMGNMITAQRMINAAVEAGADYVKFQTWKVANLKPGPWDTDGRRQIYEQAELSEGDHLFLKEHCEMLGVSFLTSCFSEQDIEFISSLTNEVKIPGPEVINQQLMEAAVKTFDTVFMSTGASVSSEYAEWAGHSKVIPLHCVSSYPCDPWNFHIDKLEHIKSICANKEFGFSGHSPVIWDAIIAITHGATVIEKHFTTDHELPGRDNQFAILPDNFAQLRKFADYYVHTLQHHPCDKILECEGNYRTHHTGRWDAT
jgi:sialic acid synthase SpsE